MGGIFGTERTAEMRINFSRRYQPFHRGKLGFELPLLIQKSIQLFNKFFALLRVISCADKLVITYFYFAEVVRLDFICLIISFNAR